MPHQPDPDLGPQLTDPSGEALERAFDHIAASDHPTHGRTHGIETTNRLARGLTDAAARRVHRLLRLLDVPQTHAPHAHNPATSLVGVTMARLHANNPDTAARIAPDGDAQTRLNADDKHAIDAFFGDGDAASDQRARRVERLLGLVDATETTAPASGFAAPGDLVSRTLAAIERERPTSDDVLAKLSPALPEDAALNPRGNMRLRDFVAVAAAVLLSAALLLPMSDNVSRERQRQLNAANLAGAGMGVGLFAGEHDGRLPQTDRRASAPRWWQVGTPEHSHSANMFTLVSGDYVRLETLASPMNRYAPTRRTAEYLRDWRSSNEVSYSYQLFGAKAPRLSDPRLLVLLADRSPVAQQFAFGDRVDANRNSALQRGEGQHLLFRDFSVRFLTSPVIVRPDGTSDNIWAPDAAVGTAGSQPRLPDNSGDVFLGP